MCGIVGLYYKRDFMLENIDKDESLRICRDMLDTLSFRGPDEKDIVQMGAAFLGHTRLSIIDLNTGRQPIYNEDKSVAVVLNGEIYNFKELKNGLENKGHIFKSQTDTEVIVHLYEEIGDEVFSKLDGMFAIIIYDLKANVLLAARDRIGEKPLLYWDTTDRIIIASELKAILQHPERSKVIDLDALALYFNCKYIPAPYTIFKEVRKLLPAHFIKIKDSEIIIRQYWQPNQRIQWGMDENAMKEEFIHLFSNSVNNRIVADVPIGCFLSGGIDSSAVTAFMAKHSPNLIKTFSVGFANGNDERPYAKIVAEKYNTDHTEIFIKEGVKDNFKKIITYFDEPFGDSSAIPTYLISKEARRHVKVILTGDGGDELFAGYDAYLNQKYKINGRVMTKLFKSLNRLTIKIFKKGLLESFYPHSGYRSAFDHWMWVRTIMTQNEIDDLLLYPSLNISKFYRNNKSLKVFGSDALSISYGHDINYYLPDDLLKKVDMASMLASLECRAPFLDHKLIEFSLRIPPQLKVKNDILKYVLKVSLNDYLPSTILHRPKIGFGAPVESLLRNQLRDMVHDLLTSGCKIETIVKKEEINKALNNVYDSSACTEHREPLRLWLLLVLEIWMRSYV